MTRSAARAGLVRGPTVRWPVVVPALAAGLTIALVASPVNNWRGTSPAAPGSRPAAARSPSSFDPHAVRLMKAVITSRASAGKALAAVVAARDSRFIPVLIEVLRASQVGILETVDPAGVVGALEALSGKPFGNDWPAWVEWYRTAALVPPAGFLGWKGRLFARIDPRFRWFFADDLPSRVRGEEIQWGGAAVDGIPVFAHPRMVPATFAAYLAPADPVFGLALDGYARAYPLRILDWHEVMNDRVGGTPVSISYCTLCGAAMAYAGRATDGRTYTFGSSGLVYRSNQLMYDHQTHTLWNQLTGEPVLGRVAGTRVRLVPIPIVLTSWREWLSEHPETKVLDVRAGSDHVYAARAAYGRYFASPEAMFPVWRRSRALPAKARIFGLRIDGVPRAFPADTLVARRVVNDTVGGTPVVLIAARGIVMAKGEHEPEQLDRVRAAAATSSAGAEVRAFARGRERFGPGPEPDIVLDASGRPWRVAENALVGPEGLLAPRLPGLLAYWFAWYAFFPHTQVYGP